jgi:hypothetical protein
MVFFKKKRRKAICVSNIPRLELRRRSKSLRARLTFRHSPRKRLPVGTVITFIRFLSVFYLPSTCSLIHDHVAFLTFHLCLASRYIYYSQHLPYGALSSILIHPNSLFAHSPQLYASLSIIPIPFSTLACGQGNGISRGGANLGLCKTEDTGVED